MRHCGSSTEQPRPLPWPLQALGLASGPLQPLASRASSSLSSFLVLGFPPRPSSRDPVDISVRVLLAGGSKAEAESVPC